MDADHERPNSRRCREQGTCNRKARAFVNFDLKRIRRAARADLTVKDIDNVFDDCVGQKRLDLIRFPVTLWSWRCSPARECVSNQSHGKPALFEVRLNISCFRQRGYSVFHELGST